MAISRGFMELTNKVLMRRKEGARSRRALAHQQKPPFIMWRAGLYPHVMETPSGRCGFTHATERVNGSVSLVTIRTRLGHENRQTAPRYAEQSDATTDAEAPAWRRQRGRRR